ncbi:MAG: hypothetical protein ACR2NX_09520 [Chthoniobacterales bacterium]
MSALTLEFIADFQRKTEELRSRITTDPKLSGFQFQRGTRWIQGLSEAQITEYESAVDATFPDDFRRMLRQINGTDRATLNVYGGQSAPKESVGVYSYPRDLRHVKQCIRDLAPDREEIATELAEQGFAVHPDARLIPIFSHRYVVCGLDTSICVFVSVVGIDAIIYGDTLRIYLEKEFLRGTPASNPERQRTADRPCA